MTTTTGRPRGISARRLERIQNSIAPLVARGLTQYEIADQLGLSKSQVAKDCLLVKNTWDDQVSERLETARGELVAKHDEIYKIAMAGYFKTKNTRMLEIASKELECLGRLLGQAGPSINLHNHSHSVTVTAEAVGDLFKPLDAGTYSEMVAAKVLPPSEPQALPDVELEAESLGTDDWGGHTPTVTPVADELSINPAGQPGAQGRNRRVSHPMR